MEGSYADYIREIIFQCIKSSRFIGNSGTETIGWIPEIGGVLPFDFLSSYCGIAVALWRGCFFWQFRPKQFRYLWAEEPAGDDYGVRLWVDFGNDDGNRHIKELRADTGRTGFFPVPINWQQRDCGKLYTGRDCTKYL